MDRMPTASEWSAFSLEGAPERDLGKDRERWDAMAPGYAHKRRRGGYLAELQKLLRLEDGESVLDFGCGPGVLSVPLALSGHGVVAVDFSDGMLAELEAAVADAGVEDRVQTFRRAWQEDWNGIPVCDVAISSRSMTTRDIADAIAKLESKARSRVVVTTAAGETPWCDRKVWQALGREVDPVWLSRGLVVLVNYLFALGRMPRVEYIVSARPHESEDLDELRGFIRRSVEPADEREEELLDAFLDAHIVLRPNGGYQTDYDQTTRWAVVTWDVSQ